MEPETQLVLTIVLVVGLPAVFAFLGDWVAEQKHRRKPEGFFLGLFLGPYGVLLEALLPTLDPFHVPERPVRGEQLVEEALSLPRMADWPDEAAAGETSINRLCEELPEGLNRPDVAGRLR